MPLLNNPGGTTAASQGTGLRAPGWKPPPAPVAPAPQPTNGLSPFTPVGVQPTQQNTPNPNQFSIGTPRSNMNGPGTFSATPGMTLPPGTDPTGRINYVDPTGTMTPYTPTVNKYGGTDWGAGGGTDLWDLNMQRIRGLMGLFGTQGGPQPTQGREQPGAMPGRETPSTMADRTAAESAAFGRAKDRIGKIGGAAMMALKDRSTAGGRAGSGLEAKEQREVIRDTAGELGEVARDQAINQLGRADQIDDRNLGAGLTQRGQDIGMRSGDYSGNITQRGQDYNALLNPYQNPMLSMIPGMMSSFMPRINY